jgi:hypothetical protein
LKNGREQGKLFKISLKKSFKPYFTATFTSQENKFTLKLA